MCSILCDLTLSPPSQKYHLSLGLKLLLQYLQAYVWNLAVSLHMSKIDIPQSPYLFVVSDGWWKSLFSFMILRYAHIFMSSLYRSSLFKYSWKNTSKYFHFHQAFQTIWHQLLPTLMFFSPWYLSHKSNPNTTSPLKSITKKIQTYSRHKVHVCHRDLKPEHFLLARTGPLDVVPLHLGWDSTQLRRTW